MQFYIFYIIKIIYILIANIINHFVFLNINISKIKFFAIFLERIQSTIIVIDIKILYESLLFFKIILM